MLASNTRDIVAFKTRVGAIALGKKEGIIQYATRLLALRVGGRVVDAHACKEKINDGYAKLLLRDVDC